jgi:predicted N-acyltransferase
LKPQNPPAFTLAVESLTEIDAAAWDACANPAAGPADAADTYNPFVSHAFLSALDESGCVGGRTGWAPAPVTIRRADGTLAAAAPAYLKSHSMCE